MHEDLLAAMKAPPRDYNENTRGIEAAYKPAYTTWKQAPTPENADALVKTVQPVMDTALRPLGNSPALRGHARRMTLLAMQNYDPERASLRTHLMSHLQGLKRISGSLDMPIHIPERVMLQQRDVAEHHQQLADDLGRDPSDIELADRTGLSTKRLAYLRQFRRPVSESQASFENADGDIVSPGVDHTTPQSVLNEFVYSDLTPRDQLIMDHAMGRNGREQLPGREIAARLNITPGAVSQRLSAIQERFNSVHDMQIFGE